MFADDDEQNRVNLFPVEQHMDTPYIAEGKESAMMDDDAMEVDSDVNEDPKREALLDDSLLGFVEEWSRKSKTK